MCNWVLIFLVPKSFQPMIVGGTTMAIFFRSQQSRRTDPHGGVQARYQMIQKKVAVFFPIRLADLKSKKRTQHTAFCRRVAVCLCRKMTDNSYPAIGEAFGRDHSR
jgi:chromosomal replication initiation ATPase DnaA